MRDLNKQVHRPGGHCDMHPFLPARRYASAGNRNVSVRLSVRLSRAGIVSKRRKLVA